MRRDNVASRILLILSVVHAAAAAPAIIRQRSLEVTKNMTPALEERANLDDDSSHLFPRMDNNPPSTSETLPLQQDDTSPAPGDPQLHSDSPPELGTPQLQGDMPPMPGAPSSQDNPLAASGTPWLHNDQPSTPGAPPSQDDVLPGSGTPQSQDETLRAPGDSQLHSGPPPELGTPQLHIDQPPTPGAPPSQEHPLPAYGTPQLHNDQPSTPGAPLSPDDTLPGSGTLQSQDETSPASGDTQLQSGLPPELGTSQLHIDQPPTSGSPQLHIDQPSSSGTPGLQDHLPLMPGTPPSEDDRSESSASGTLQLHNDQPPARATLLWGDDSSLSSGDLQLDDESLDESFWQWVQANLRGGSSYDEPSGESSYGGSPGTSSISSGAPQLQNDPLRASITPQLPDYGTEEFDSSYRDLPVTEWRPSSPDFDSDTPLLLYPDTPPPLHSETLPLLESEALPSAPETHTWFNDADMQKLKTYGVVGVVAGVSVGLAFGVVKKLIDDHSHKSHPAGRDLSSSGVVGRGTNMHPRLRKSPVSRAPAKLRDEDLRLLSILTRRALERLD